MLDDSGSIAAKLPIEDADADAIQRLGRWMRIVGTIQLAIAGMSMLLFGLAATCGMMAAGESKGMLGLVIAIAVIATFLVQALRIQAAGEQFKNLADDREVDYLELAFARLKTVYIIDVVIAGLICALIAGGSL